MSFFFDMIAAALAFFYQLVPSYGFAIIALTLVVMIVLTPLTLKGTRSMMMMQQLQPEMKKLQSKYKDDRQKLNEELLKFYKENNINPVGGCLPLLIQMPVFLVLYNVLRGLTQRVPSLGSNVGWVSGQTGVGLPVSKPPTVLNNFVPQYLPQDSKMYQNLSQTNTMPFAEFGFLNLSESCSDALRQGIVHALPYVVLIAIVGVSGFVQQRQIQGRTPNSQIPQQQQQIMKIMPIFLPVISFGLPSGLVVYFAVSNLYRIGQQWFISRSIYGIKRGEKPDNLSGTKAGSTAKTAAGAKKAATKADAKADAIKTTATKTSGAKTSAAKAPATKTNGTKTNGTKTNGAKTAPAKTNGVAASNGGRNGNGNGAKTPASGRSSDATNEARPAKASGTKTPPDDPKATPPTRESPAAPPPTLQPRARKNKKR